ncbi:MAG: polysaccharide biosynthesis protein [Fimbriimonadaceae bacterium]|nr:polysaccharide biosynthesis protein [Fimbriimonadaceae bacterium]QYK56894.1 MAG: polysaccharide biosynthesis protein [Fimbriimonadaceae bacterium]
MAGYITRYGAPITALAVALIAWRRLYRINPRYVGVHDLLGIALVGTLLAVALRGLVSLGGLPPETNPWTSPVLFGFMVTGFLAMVRIYQRLVASRTLAAIQAKLGGRLRRAMIVGAGDAGESLLREIAKLDPPEYAVVGFLDDDPRRHETTINGVPVLGDVNRLRLLAEEHEIDDLLIALPETSAEEIRRITALCNDTKARVRTLPNLSRFVRGGTSVLPLLQDVNVDDLLRRESTMPEAKPVARYLSGERVLITGAGGSIGSELARQVAQLSPASLVLIGKGENSIFEIDQELRHGNIFQPIPIVADVRDASSMEEHFRVHRPTVVFHAAAHKHVPLMEAVPIEAVRNNVFGTLNTAELAIRNGVQKFILVSTDKAVNPSNVMGATKRVAEMIISALASRSETSFAAVRFGNVLGSRGSLVPVLKKQILAGGPITITHPQMTRFFMTIPEAVQLILQAGAMGDRGEIFILDMGEPVSIVELAKDMVRLHGLVPGHDIEIKYTGIRPGEKIHEELSYETENIVPSGYEKISRVSHQRPVDWLWLRDQLAELKDFCDAGNAEAARAFLLELSWGKTMPPVRSS